MGKEIYFMKSYVGILAAATFATGAMAAPDDFIVEQVDITAADQAAISTNAGVGSEVSWVVNDIFIDVDPDVLKGLQMYATGLEEGEVFQYDGSPFLTTPPSRFDAPSFFRVPGSEWTIYDSFLALGWNTVSGNDAIPGAAGAAVDAGGRGFGSLDNNGELNGSLFTEGAINTAWFVETGQTVPGGDKYFVARITLADTANGSINLFGSDGEVAEGEDSSAANLLEPYVIVDGAILVPEPATAALLGLGGLAMLRRRG
jgi:hypothetical protein